MFSVKSFKGGGEVKLLKVLFVFLFVLEASADIASSNARFLKGIGKVVVCEGQRPVMLDYYEGVQQYHLKMELPKTRNVSASVFDKAREVFLQLAPIHTARTAFYIGMLEGEFRQKARWLKDFSLHQGDVDTAILLKPNCKQDTVLQISIRGDNHIDAKIEDLEYNFLINMDLLSQMDELNQVMVLVHTILSFEGVMLDFVETPHPTRLYVAMLLSDRIRKMSRKEFDKFIEQIDYSNILDLVAG
ncbi:MAG: hypothetical protein VX642_06405 [Bdellovibrionota bacterium]|nr:hypothetical protein [Bdellovibrionota bacterium]